MNRSDVQKLYAYTDWANEKFLDGIGKLSGEQLTRRIESSFPSIRETLGHIASTEWLWLQRWRGESPTAVPAWADEQSVAVLAANMRQIAEERRAFLSQLTDEAVEGTIHYRSIKGDAFALPLKDVLVHCANHSTYHRGQLVTMLRQVGATPPNSDYSLFARE